jgi:hypothetical protein
VRGRAIQRQSHKRDRPKKPDEPDPATRREMVPDNFFLLLLAGVCLLQYARIGGRFTKNICSLLPGLKGKSATV